MPNIPLCMQDVLASLMNIHERGRTSRAGTNGATPAALENSTNYASFEDPETADVVKRGAA